LLTFDPARCGVVVLGVGSTAYSDNAFANDLKLGARVETLADALVIRRAFPEDITTGSFEGTSGYLNRDGGWAYAAQGVSQIQSKVESLGGKVIPGQPVSSLTRKDGKTSGVKCSDGTEHRADIVVLASGAWTSSTFPELNLEDKCLATGQSVAFLQLTPEEGEKYKQCPVYLDFSSGFYCFPTNNDNVVKMAIHCAGHTFADPANSGISTPRTSLSHADDGLRIPRSAAQALRSNLRLVYPELANQPFSETRICWYTDSPDDDWVIGYHPTDTGLVFATAGSGHAYKFLPNVGRIVADAIEGKLDLVVKARFAVDRQKATHVASRTGKPQILRIDELCTPEDLTP